MVSTGCRLVRKRLEVENKLIKWIDAVQIYHFMEKQRTVVFSLTDALCCSKHLTTHLEQPISTSKTAIESKHPQHLRVKLMETMCLSCLKDRCWWGRDKSQFAEAFWAERRLKSLFASRLRLSRRTSSHSFREHTVHADPIWCPTADCSRCLSLARETNSVFPKEC